jgi:hypothetical protein
LLTVPGSSGELAAGAAFAVGFDKEEEDEDDCEEDWATSTKVRKP